MTKGQNLLWQVDEVGVVRSWHFRSGYESTSGSWRLFLNLSAIVAHGAAHASAAALHVADAFPLEAPFCDFVGHCDRLCAYNDLSTIALAIMRQVFSPHLFLGAHEFAHCDIDLTDGIVITTTVTINEDKSVLLHLFEEVGQSE